MVEVAIADRGIDLDKNFGGETGDVLILPNVIWLPFCCYGVEALGWSGPLDSRGELPRDFLPCLARPLIVVSLRDVGS